MIRYEARKCGSCDILGSLEAGKAFKATNGWVYPVGADPTKDDPWYCPVCHGTGQVEVPVVVPEVSNDLPEDELLDF